MADDQYSPPRGAQDTGNPVLDSLVNLLSACDVLPTEDNVRNLHKWLLELAQQEPGCLKVRGPQAVFAVSRFAPKGG